MRHSSSECRETASQQSSGIVFGDVELTVQSVSSEQPRGGVIRFPHVYSADYHCSEYSNTATCVNASHSRFGKCQNMHLH